MKLTTASVMARITAAPTRYCEMASKSKTERAKLHKIIDRLMAQGAIKKVYISRFPYYVPVNWAPSDAELLADIEGRGRPTLDGCLLWSEYVDEIVGPIWRGSVEHGPRSVRRTVWEIRSGTKLTYRDVIKPECGNPACIAFEHLRKTTRAEPLKGRRKTPGHAMRIAKAAQANAKRLDWDKVRAIRASGENPAVLALRYGVSKQLIGAVLRNEIWKETPAGMFTGLIARQAA